MGQANSRTESAQRDGQQQREQREVSPPPRRREARRSSMIAKRASTMRRSIVQAVSKSPSVQSTNGEEGSPRRRLWSRAKPPAAGALPAEDERTLDDSEAIASSSTMRPPSVVSRSKGKERARPPDAEQDSLDAARSSTPLPASGASTPAAEPPREDINSWLGAQPAQRGRPTLSERLRLTRSPPPEPSAPVPAPTPAEPAEPPQGAEAPPDASTAEAPAPEQTRPFPPAGTLVVVQGVVHTTDASAAAPQQQPQQQQLSTPATRGSTPRPSTPVGNRLSQFLSRPTSMLSPDASPRPTSGSLPTEPEPAADAPREESSAPPYPDPQDNRPGPLSANSIDVLGTLLSVAAAATAASLVTGSSDPLFTSGLANRAANAAPAPTPTFPGALGALAALANGAIQNPAERRRTPWDSIRERLGLVRGTSPARAATPTPPVTADAASAEAPASTPRPTDQREILLQDMVRSLNLGLGLGVPAAPSAEEPPRPVAPEGSFERFLIDLQVDLRRALSEDVDDAPAPAARTPDAPPAPSPQGEAAAAVSITPPTPEVAAAEHDDASSSSFAAAPVRAAEAVDQTDDDDMPALASLSDSSDDEDEDAMLEDGLPTFGPADASAIPIPTGAGGRAANGGINWWRLYRFPPMPAPQARGLAHAAGQPHAAAPSAPTTTPVSTTPGESLVEPTTAESTGTAEPNATAEANASAAVDETNVVVPIIVVGLQSVNAHRHREPSAHEHAHEGVFGEDGEGQAEAEAEMEEAPRTWQTRAADAMRGLMPGRRVGQERRASDGAGSRTFLIYVIGGYYPPNHHIVTGADNLDSFEALLELAELLGQVKPPVATKDEIEKSGLQIIRPADLKPFETEGKVSSNCVDRCLICLDDYEETDELRLMTCRHAFHKDCVDKWMQIGRNNCPACRGKGVSTGDETASSSVPPPAATAA